MTMPLVEKLNEIHNQSFGEACEKIEIYQEKYKKKYDKKNKVKEFSLKNGDRIQVKRIKTKRSKGGKTQLNWFPRNSYYTILKINKRRKTVQVKNKNGRVLKTLFNFDRIRPFHGV